MEESVEAPIETTNEQDPSTPERPEPVVEADSSAKEKVFSSEDCEESKSEDEDSPAVATADEQRLTEKPTEENSEPEVLDSKEEEENLPENLADEAEMGQAPSSRKMLLDQAGILLGRDKNGKSPPKPERREDEDLEKYSESLMDHVSSGEEGKETGNGKRVRFADEVIKIPERSKNAPQSVQRKEETRERSSPEDVPDGVSSEAQTESTPSPTPTASTSRWTNEQIVAGVTYSSQYLGSTPVIFSSSQKTVRMQQARDAVRLIKDPDSDGSLPRFNVDLKISAKDIIIADSQTKTELMVHPLKSVSYVADIDGALVIMAHRNPVPSPDAPIKLSCHVLDTSDPREVAVTIGQAFSTAYKEFLKSHGIEESALEQAEYQHVLSSQNHSESELNSLTNEKNTRAITLAKHKGDILGLMVIDSGYGSAIPSCIVAHMSKTGSALQSGLLNVGDYILSINGVSLVGMPIKTITEQIKKCRNLTVVRMVICSCPPVQDVTIMRPDLKFQLGFAVRDGNICSLWRGSIGERSGVRVGHRIIEINGTSTVDVSHEEIVHMLSTTVGDLHLRTMPIIMYQLLTGKAIPEYV